MIVKNIEILSISLGHSIEWESFQLTAPEPHGEGVQLSVTAHVVGGEREGHARILTNRLGKEIKQLETSSKNRTDVRSVGQDQTIRVDSPYTNVLASLQAKRGLRSSAFTLLDAYRPISDRCLGTQYIIAPVDGTSGHSFVVVKSLKDETLVYLTLASDGHDIPGGLLEVDGRLYGPGDTAAVKMKPRTSKTLSSVDVGSGLAMPGMSIVTSHAVAVFAGSVDSEPETNAANARRVSRSMAYEMLPPVAMLGTQYVVSNPEMATLTGERLTIVKIIGFHDKTSLRVTSYTGSGRRQSKVSSTIERLQSGQELTRLLKESASLVVISDQPIQVLQVVARDNGRYESMAVLPARHAWTNTYQVHALPVDGFTEAVHQATIVAETSQIEGLLVISQTDYTDVSSDLRWVTIGDTGLSTTSLVFTDFSLFRIFHIDEDVAFQVMLTGVNTKGPGAYSTTAGRSHRCEGSARDTGVTTASPPDSTTTGAVTVTTTPSGSSTTTSAATANTTTAVDVGNATTVAANVTSNVTTQAPAANTTTAAPENADSGMSTGAIAGTAAAVGAAVTGAVVAAVAVNASGAAVAATGTAAATTAVGANAAAAGAAAAGNAAATAGANAAATGAMVSTTHGGGTAIASAANPAMVAVI
ncbi:hypothetical protein ElyMa_002125600 [Elysia marginata]|uniref:IgGFc-binding protein N-terminal domain-containing protein n=1 Tax=Elysia marginata TaxID=1093978 RepID=A0AAV4FHW4_9GAST|nr:hypothetical protein ElyMa_002125600 [Elysia marginata]